MKKDPYKIWLSEIILQQTRVEQGLKYFNRFISKFPDIHQLARADDHSVFKLWEGLGYYSRCRNLLATARYISKELDGKFPATYPAILNLKGVGAYTAAAISSFAYNLPHAVIDGNVFRVIARIFGVEKASDTTEGKKIFSKLANELLDKKQAGLYNQAIMDFGATICKPQAPVCGDCVFKSTCYAFQNNQVNDLPVKGKKIKVRHRWFNYLILSYKNEILIHERTVPDIWRHLYEFTLVETTRKETTRAILKKALQQKLVKPGTFSIESSSGVLKQQLSHQLISGQFIRLEVTEKFSGSPAGRWIKKNQLKKYPFPGFINQYLRQLFN